jgi:predicted Ser/Thr protein kinase
MKVGETIEGRYRIERPLGEGGMGKVYLAHDLELDKKVAIKTLLPQTASDIRAVEQLKKEVRLAQDLRHENICGVYHFQPSGEEPFVVMEFIDGEKLTHFIFRQSGHRCDEATFRRLAAQILAAVEHAHRAGVIHRDLSSGNIMVRRDGAIRVMDFGIAASLKEAQSRATGSEVTVSIHYASPEQINGEAPSVSMDVYSLGCVFYEMLTGQPPFRQGDILHQQLTRQPDPMPGVSPALNQAVLACLVKDRTRRLRSAAEVRAALDGRLPAGPILDRTIKIGKPVRAAVASPRNWIRVIWAAVVVLVLIGFGVLIKTLGTQPQPIVKGGPVQPQVHFVDPSGNPPVPEVRKSDEDAKRKKREAEAARQAAEEARQRQREAEEARRRAILEYLNQGKALSGTYDWLGAKAAYERVLNLDRENAPAKAGKKNAEDMYAAECRALGCK